MRGARVILPQRCWAAVLGNKDAQVRANHVAVPSASGSSRFSVSYPLGEQLNGHISDIPAHAAS